MSLREMILSGKPGHRLQRHVVFWCAWLLYIIFTTFATPEITGKANSNFHHHQAGLNELGYLHYSLLVFLKSSLLLFTHMCFCYAVLYFLLSNFLVTKKYVPLVVGIVLLCVLMIPLGYFLYALVYPLIDELFRLKIVESRRVIIWSGISAGLIGSIKLTLVAVAIKLLKRWWLKQKEKGQLEREKISTELQLLKAQVHPTFLVNTLNNIISHAEVASPRAPEMLIRLSDLLSYMLYECDGPEVGIEKEISMTKDYIELEKLRQGERLEITVQINGITNGHSISPLILLPFIDNSLSYCDDQRIEQPWINVDITIEDDKLSMKIINGLVAGSLSQSSQRTDRLNNVRKRLELLYPGRHELKINADQEILLVYLNLKLEVATPGERTAAATPKPTLSYAGI